MNHFKSLLLPLDGSPEAAKGAGCALWLAEALGATLHVLHAANPPHPGGSLPKRLHLPPSGRANVVLHQTEDPADSAVLAAIDDYNADLVIMTARGESASAGRMPSQRLGGIAQRVLESTPVPVLLLPLHYREVLPWRSILVAASGELVADNALEAATQLAAALDLGVTVVHVGNGHATSERPLGAYSDSAHHEYAYRMEEMVERGLVSCTEGERRCVQRVLLRAGDPAEVLLHEVQASASHVLALGYHGSFVEGHAFVLKRLLEQVHCPLLLLRGVETKKGRLRIGEEIEQ